MARDWVVLPPPPPRPALLLPSHETGETGTHMLENCKSTGYLVWSIKKVPGEPAEEMEGRG